MGKREWDKDKNKTHIRKKDKIPTEYRESSVKLYIPEDYKTLVFTPEIEARLKMLASFHIERSNKNVVTFSNSAGKLDKLRSVVNVYEQVYRLEHDGYEVDEREIENLISEYFKDSNDEQYKWNPDAIFEDYKGRFFTPRTENQKDLVTSIRKNILTIVEGAAGTGKSRIALIMALNALNDNRIDRIVIVRPLVTVGADIGFLPGGLEEKIDPYNSPITEAFVELVGKDVFAKYVEDERIEFFPAAFARGCNISNAYVIIDEAQNLDQVTLLTLLTRLCANTKMIVTGDQSQDDRKDKNRTPSALKMIKDKLEDVENVGIIEMSIDDVQRSRIVKEILQAFE